MIKILHVIYSLEVGGAQRLVSDLLPVMKSKDISVSVLVNYRVHNNLEKRLEDSGVPILTIGIKSVYHPFIPFRIVPILGAYDVVHAHLFPNLYFVALASCFSKVKLVYTEHNTINRRRTHCWMSYIERIVYNRYHIIISISKGTQDNLKGWLKVKESDKRFVVIQNGISIPVFKGLDKNKTYPVTLIVISRFSIAKDQETVIKAMPYLDNSIHVIFVGDGVKRKGCEELAQSLKVSDRCHFVGEQQNIPLWITKADIGVQSSHWEGFGLTAVEMMAGGLPIISSDVDGLKQVVEGAGIIFERGNEIALANEVKHLVNDKKYYEKVSKACVKRAEDFNIVNTAQAYTKIYRELINH